MRNILETSLDIYCHFQTKISIFSLKGLMMIGTQEINPRRKPHSEWYQELQ